ncbi:hypothetical protein ACKKBG_A02000 [Auxenochlorella protothecoides x Auxenochlorella symbiontica]
MKASLTSSGAGRTRQPGVGPVSTTALAPPPPSGRAGLAPRCQHSMMPSGLPTSMRFAICPPRARQLLVTPSAHPSADVSMATSQDEVTVDLALEARCDLGESPVWDGKTNTLYFVDINGRTIHGFQPETGEHFTIKADEPTGTIVPTNDPTKILVATQRDILVVDVPGRKVTKQAIATTPEEHGTEGFRFNDGKVSPSGTLLIGRMSNKWRKGERGRQYRLDPGSSTLVEVMSPEEVHLPNGIAWDGAKGVVYFIDSSTEEVRAYAADEQGIMRRGEDGALSWRTVTHRPSGLATVPDGMTIDTDGNLWVAHGESGEVTCYHPESGAVLHKVPLPVQRPTACTFGGRDLGDLYVTTRVETGEGAHKHHGGLYRIRIPGVKGVAPAYEYAL